MANYNLSEEQNTVLKTFFLNGFISAFHSHQELFNKKRDNLMIALSYLNEADSHFVASRVLCANLYFEEFQHTINKFILYSNEFKKCVRTDHSHQHTDIYFRDFVDSFKTSAILLELDIYNWVEKIDK
jgi:hypothetical protein